MLTIPPFNTINRLLIIAAGIILLIWSGFEDNQVTGVVILGWVLAIYALIVLIQSRFGDRSISTITALKLSPFFGGTVGALASLATVFLMLFKDIRHAHVFPDYPPQMMIAILERLPIWTIGSGFVAFGLAILFYLIVADKGDNSAADSVTM